MLARLFSSKFSATVRAVSLQQPWCVPRADSVLGCLGFVAGLIFAAWPFVVCCFVENSMVLPTTLCPVPEEQQPLNEFKQLQESWFFSWAMLPRLPFISRLAIVWGLGFGLAIPISLVSFPFSKLPLQCLWAAALGACFPAIFVLVQLYLGWTYVGDRLRDVRIFYEESGWYDGQYWTKPEQMLAQDQLVVTYQIQPLLRRIQKSLAAIAALFALSAVVWPLVFHP